MGDNRFNRKGLEIMNINIMRWISLVSTIVIFSTNTYASDVAKEKRWADQIVDSIMVGDAQWLDTGKHKFLGIYAENENDKEAGAVIIMHGIGIHPNWDTIIRPLRSDLPASGWHTLSIQMPILKNEAEFKDYIPLFPEVAPRITAAISFLKGKGINNIILIGHSLGSTMGAHYMAGKVDNAVVAYVSIGASGGSDYDVDYLKSLSKIKHPVLEVYGSEDLPQVINTVNLKAKAAKDAGNSDYKQIKIPGADHFFAGKNDALIKPVAEWIARFASK
jgi:pimeloyl-ACP methyl ester carboxylesterase